MTDLEVHPLRESDRPSLCEMLESSRDCPTDVVFQFRRPTPPYAVRAAWVSGEIVGMLSGSMPCYLDEVDFGYFDLPPGPHAFLSRLHVHEDYRARGVARLLVEDFAYEAESRRCTFIAGILDHRSDPAGRRAAFERLGFLVDLSTDRFGGRPTGVLHSRAN